MYAGIHIRELLQMADESEAATELCMDSWTSRCHTAGCHIGTWCINHPGDRLVLLEREPRLLGHRFKDTIDAIMMRFNLPRRIARFLFLDHNGECDDACNLSQDRAVTRLRKVARYLKRKKELWEEWEWYAKQSRKFRLATPEPSLEPCLKERKNHGKEEAAALPVGRMD